MLCRCATGGNPTVNRVLWLPVNPGERIYGAVFSSKIFRSRWSALFWAAGIIWTAYDVAEANVPSKASNNTAAAQTDATGAAVDSADLAVLANAIGSAEQ